MTNHQHINSDSGKDEYYTPSEIVECARRVLGVIDLDPASSQTANEIVKSSHIFTLKDNGLSQPWNGRIWMNHPFGRETNGPWITKLVSEFEAGNVKQAVCITFASTSEKWFQPLIKHPQCYLTPRTNYHLSDGTLKRGVTKGSVVTYFGANIDKFATEFRTFGTIKVNYIQSK